MDKVGGDGKHIEVDETFIGGAARFHAQRVPHSHDYQAWCKGQNCSHGHSRAWWRCSRACGRQSQKHLLEAHVRAHIKAGSAICSDNFASYDRLKNYGFQHQVVDHAEKYVDGQVHTNGLENFWSLVKRGLKGAYISVEPFHLFRYLDEQVYRYNNRKLENDGERFQKAVLRQIACAPKKAQFPAVTAVPSRLSLHPGAPRISLGGTREVYVYIKDGRTGKFSRRYVGSD